MRKLARFCSSSMRPMRRMGLRCVVSSKPPPGRRRFAAPSVGNGPGAMALRRMPWRPHSTASDFRSEEHTSELQSLAYLVCRLLLEKKKQKLALPPLSEEDTSVPQLVADLVRIVLLVDQITIDARAPETRGTPPLVRCVDMYETA